MTDEQARITVIDRQGNRHQIPCIPGWSVMEVIRDFAKQVPAVGLKAECGGACACATCHVYLHPDSASLLPQPSEEEEACLDQAISVRPSSRLSCQLLLENPQHLTVTLTDATEP